MKQKLLLVLSCMLVSLGLQAEDATVTFSNQGYSNGDAVTECSIGNHIVATFDKGTNTNAPKYYTTGTALRIYGGGTMTLTAPNNVTINSVTMTTASGNPVNSASTVSKGTLAIDGTTATISDINANSVTFTQGGSSGHVRIVSVTVNYSIDESVAVVPNKPTLTTSCKFLESQEVEISCSTDSATIYYTTDGTEPTTGSSAYSDPFTVTETTTVKAIAVNENGPSDTAEATYIKAELMTIAEAKAAYDADGNTEVFIDLTGAVVTVNSGQYLFIQDATTGINIYGSGVNYEVGTQFTAGVLNGTSTAYGKMRQISSATFSDVDTTTTTVVPIEVTVADLADADKYDTYEGRYVKLTGVTLEVKTITQGEDTYAAYDRFGLEFADKYATATTCDIEGVPARYNSTLQIYPVVITAEETGGESTGIETIADESAAPVVYDLLGRRVDNATRGIYIVNGKKVVVK